MVLEMERTTEGIIGEITAVDTVQSSDGCLADAITFESSLGFIVPRGLEVNQVNGVIGGHQTGTNALKEIEESLAWVRREYRRGVIDRAKLYDEKRLLLDSRRRIFFIQSKGSLTKL